MKTRTQGLLQEVLYELSIAQPVPDAQLLDEFVRRYPEYAEDLTAFAIELALDAVVDEAVVPTVERTEVPTSEEAIPAVARAMERFQNILHAALPAQREDQSAKTAVDNPFASLGRDDFRSLAKRLSANTVFVQKLRDRQIDPDTISAGFTAHVAEQLRVPTEVLVAHLAAPPQLLASMHFRAEQKPEVGKHQSFEQAVRGSGLSEEQQGYLLGL